MARIAVIALLGMLGLAACGEKNMILADPTEQFLVKGIEKRTGFHARDVSCPSGVEAKAGGTFDCHFTGPDGFYVVHMEIVKVDGTRVVYHWHSVPAGQ